jgi:hypothetical protein
MKFIHAVMPMLLPAAGAHAAEQARPASGVDV